MATAETRPYPYDQTSWQAQFPQTWNSLLLHLRSSTISRDQFRFGLKSHLFKCTYTGLYLRELLMSELTYLLYLLTERTPLIMTLNRTILHFV